MTGSLHATGRLALICSGNGCALQDLTYNYDPADNLASRTRATSTAPTTSSAAAKPLAAA